MTHTVADSSGSAFDAAAPASAPTPEQVLVRSLAASVRMIPGVYALGTPMTRMIGVAWQRVTGQENSAGITLNANPPALDVRVALVAEYPANLTALAELVREDVRVSLAPHHAGPLHIDVAVTGVHGPFDTALPEPEPGAEPGAEPEPRLPTEPEAQPDAALELAAEPELDDVLGIEPLPETAPAHHVELEPELELDLGGVPSIEPAPKPASPPHTL